MQLLTFAKNEQWNEFFNYLRAHSSFAFTIEDKNALINYLINSRQCLIDQQHFEQVEYVGDPIIPYDQAIDALYEKDFFSGSALSQAVTAADNQNWDLMLKLARNNQWSPFTILPQWNISFFECLLKNDLKHYTGKILATFKDPDSAINIIISHYAQLKKWNAISALIRMQFLKKEKLHSMLSDNNHLIDYVIYLYTSKQSEYAFRLTNAYNLHAQFANLFLSCHNTENDYKTSISFFLRHAQWELLFCFIEKKYDEFLPIFKNLSDERRKTIFYQATCHCKWRIVCQLLAYDMLNQNEIDEIQASLQKNLKYSEGFISQLTYFKNASHSIVLYAPKFCHQSKSDSNNGDNGSSTTPKKEIRKIREKKIKP